MIDPIIIQPDTEIITTNFGELFKNSYVDPAEEMKPQPVAISIGYSEYKGTNYPIPFGSYGDFSCIVGASKSKKTFFKSMIEAGYIGGNSVMYCPEFKGHGSKDKLVVSVDTEQSRYHTQRVQRRVLEMTGANHEMYKTHALREFPPNERMQFIEFLIFESDYRNHIGLLSIDGYVDLVTDFNSLEQATGLTENLMRWSSKANIHITGILHKNFGTAKPVGHVGSSVLKKAETVAFVEVDGKISNIKCEYSRNLPFEPFAFAVNENWLPYVVDENSINY
jgi:hypothetical protein